MPHRLAARAQLRRLRAELRRARIANIMDAVAVGAHGRIRIIFVDEGRTVDAVLMACQCLMALAQVCETARFIGLLSSRAVTIGADGRIQVACRGLRVHTILGFS
jgi:hypothetical protein